MKKCYSTFYLIFTRKGTSFSDYSVSSIFLISLFGSKNRFLAEKMFDNPLNRSSRKEMALLVTPSKLSTLKETNAWASVTSHLTGITRVISTMHVK